MKITLKNAWLASILLSSAAAFAAQASFEEGLRLKNAKRLPEAAQVFKQLTVADPGDVAATEQLALVESWLNHFDASISAWRRVLALDPHREGARVSLARVLYWKGERAEALQLIGAQLAAQPSDYDAQVLQGDVLMADGRAGAARESYMKAQALHHGAQDGDLNRKIAGAVEPSRWRMDLGGVRDHFNNVRGNESASYAQLGYTLSQNAGVYLHYDWMREFKVEDQGIVAGGYWRASHALLLTGEAGGTLDTAEFRPNALVVLGAEWLSSARAQPLLGVRYMHYDLTKNVADPTGPALKAGKVTTVTPGIRLMAPGIGNVELRYGFTNNLDGSDTGVAQARLNFDPLQRFTPYLALAHGKEALPPLPPATLTVVSAGAVYDYSANFSARLDVAYEHRPDFYDHETMALGFSYKF
jgi:YaiO family outer membrane protein